MTQKSATVSPTMNTRVIEYYFALASPWSYLGNDRLRAIAAAHDATIDPIIVDYDRMFTAAGTIPLPHRPPLAQGISLGGAPPLEHMAGRAPGAGTPALSRRDRGTG